MKWRDAREGFLVHSIKRRTNIEEGNEGDLVLIDGRIDVGEHSEVRLSLWNDICGNQTETLETNHNI